MLRFVLLGVISLGFAIAAHGHDTPVQLPPPRSTPEAWNVIEQSKANVDQLLAENLMRDIGPQLVNIASALRALDAESAGDSKAWQIHELTRKLLMAQTDLLQDTRAPEDPQGKFRLSWEQWRTTVSQLEALFPNQTVMADVYICPMHPTDVYLHSADKCAKCGMSLVKRHLPASAVYQTPGQATLKLTAKCAPLVVGKPADVIIHLSRPDGTPVTFADLLEVHTKKIHLLINDKSLGDYHHEHPQPTQTAGEYRFTFTPSRPGPYRIWADIVPASSSVQEYDIADLPAETTGGEISDRQTRLWTTVDGRRFELAFQSSDSVVHADQTVIGTITITESDGSLCKRLEPIMGAFAHLVGFSEDGKSVLHIHPYGKEPTSPDDRAGPGFAFKFYAPTPGFLRLYCQVHINGHDVFAPFNLNIQATR